MKKCKCYIEKRVPIVLNSTVERFFKLYGIKFKQPKFKTEGRCLGTMRTEICTCKGDETHCNFYPKKGKMETETTKRIKGMED